VGEVVLPEGVRESQLYQNMVEKTLRLLIEQVGGAESPYRGAEKLPDDVIARRAAGNAVEALGFMTFRASPVWILAALADVAGMGRHLIPEIAEALKAKGLLEKDAEFTSVDQMLNGLERTSSRLASAINTPPLDVLGLREEWAAIQEEARGLQAPSLPTREAISSAWGALKAEAARQNRSIFETSSLLAVSAVRAIPDGLRWLRASTRAGATRTGHIFAEALLDHYRQTLGEMRQVGYVAYADRQLRPYFRAAAAQLSPKRQTLTDHLLDRLAKRRARRRARPRR
jgi:hypothetical protein